MRFKGSGLVKVNKIKSHSDFIVKLLSKLPQNRHFKVISAGRQFVKLEKLGI